MRLPNPNHVDADLRQSAFSLLQAFHKHLEEQDDAGSSKAIPSSMSKEIVETCRLLNSGHRLPFRESLAVLLLLTSTTAASWSSPALQAHPFENDYTQQNAMGGPSRQLFPQI